MGEGFFNKRWKLVGLSNLPQSWEFWQSLLGATRLLTVVIEKKEICKKIVEWEILKEIVLRKETNISEKWGRAMTLGNDGGGWGGSSPTNTPTESTITAIAVISVRLVFQHVQTKKPFADQDVSWVEVFKDITVDRRYKEWSLLPFYTAKRYAIL